MAPPAEPAPAAAAGQPPAPRRLWRTPLVVGVCFGLGYGITHRLLALQWPGFVQLGQGFDVRPFPGTSRESLRQTFGAEGQAIRGDLDLMELEAQNRQAEEQAQAREDLIVHSLLAGVGIFLMLYVAFGRLRNLLLTFANLPFALIGGVLAVMFTGGWISLGSLVGFVTLFGITLRNSIMLVSHFQHLVDEEGCEWGLETAIRGASERLPSILMTALVTALGLLPLAAGSGQPGREIEGPMATIIVGGLMTSTILNLLILPTIMLHFGKFVKQGKFE